MVDPRILRYLERRRRQGLPVRDVVPLVGDASNRSYYRVHLQETSLVLALMPEAFEPETLPFLNVARLFQQIPVRIPQIHDVSGKEGILLLEDLGDNLLQHHVRRIDEKAKRRLYREALSILIRIQARGAELRDERFFPYRLALDYDKLFGELVFFERHFLVGFRGARLSSDERAALRRSFKAIASELAERPRVLCHRDYHSRNLILHGQELAVIDFQDARMGPASYDLVSLLRDSYVDHDPDFVAEMVEEFCRGAGRVDVREELDLTALQRNLKALGTFGYQISVKNNKVYLPYVSTTLGSIRRNLESKPRWDRLRKALGAHLAEIA